MKEAKYPIVGSNVMFRETFNSALDVHRDEGVATDVTFSNGVGIGNGSTSDITYSKTLEYNRPYSIKIKGKFLTNNSSKTMFSIGLIGSGDSDVVGCGVQSGIGTDNELTFAHWWSSWNVCGSGIVPVLGQTYDIVCTNDTTNLKIYVDGDLKNTVSAGGGGINSSNQSPRIFRRNDNSNPNKFIGELYHINIYNKVLTAAEVSNLYNNKQYTGLVIDGLVGFWDFTKQTAFDWSNSNNNSVLTTGDGGFLKQGLLFGGTTKVEVGNIAQTIKTIGLVVRLDSTTDELIDIDGTNKMEVSTGTLSCGGFSLEYIDGVLLNTGVSANKYYYLVVTDPTGVLASDFDIGENSLNGIVKAIHINTDQLTIEQLVQNFQYFRTGGYLNG